MINDIFDEENIRKQIKLGPHEKISQIMPLGINYECPNCHDGNMIADEKAPFIFKDGKPVSRVHYCNNCGARLNLNKIYPYIEWVFIDQEREDIMKQHEFVWKIHANTDVHVVQTVNGITECTIKDGIIISHNYKKNNQILLVMNEFNKKYIISSDKELNEIFKIVNSNDSVITQLLIEYADKNLTLLK